MTKDVGILVLGLLVAAMPFLGFPGGVEQLVFVVSGIVIALLAFFIRSELGGSGEKETESYVQNGHSRTETGVEGDIESANGEEESTE
jgi:hypothetical protein